MKVRELLELLGIDEVIWVKGRVPVMDYEIFQHGDTLYKTHSVDIDHKLKSIELY